MIKFFRRIRKSLINQSRMRKYFFYAIGEIVLVVIGILIALQINNWNEQQKLKLKEEAALVNILNSIEGDLELFNDIFKTRLDLKQKGIDSLFTYSYAKKSLPDSLFMKYYNRMKIDIVLRFDDGPFEALKSSGLEIISNNELRTSINQSYTVALPAFKGFANTTSNENQSQIDKLELIVFDVEPFLHKDGRKHLHFKPKTQNILQQQDFLAIMGLEIEKLDDFKSRLQSMEKIMERLKSKIETELAL